MNSLRIGMVSVLALATAGPVYAQQYRETPQSQDARRDYEYQRQQYDAQRQNYQDQQEQYRDSRDRYEGQRRNYREARRDYDRRLAEWNRARSIYDARYGYGAYARLYARPVWDQTYWSSYNPPPYAGYYGRNSSAYNDRSSADTARCDSNSTVAGGVIGALAGAVLGSQVASHGNRTEGSVIGGVLGAAVGAGVGNAHDKYQCDSRGPYFSYNDTIEYREGRDRYSSAYDYGYYTRQRCRLAPAPVDAYGRDYRYVRVCPDQDGRYRITG